MTAEEYQKSSFVVAMVTIFEMDGLRCKGWGDMRRVITVFILSHIISCFPGTVNKRISGICEHFECVYYNSAGFFWPVSFRIT